MRRKLIFLGVCIVIIFVLVNVFYFKSVCRIRNSIRENIRVEVNHNKTIRSVKRNYDVITTIKKGLNLKSFAIKCVKDGCYRLNNRLKYGKKDCKYNIIENICINFYKEVLGNKTN
ncbi:MAG: hypothetical protein ACRCW0_04210 [Clostridium sp.]